MKSPAAILNKSQRKDILYSIRMIKNMIFFYYRLFPEHQRNFIPGDVRRRGEFVEG